MSIELTPVGVACNLKCSYCYEEPMREAGNYSPGYDLDAMKAGLIAAGVGPDEKQAGWTLFGGEPLMMKFPDLEEILRWGFEIRGSTGIQTNGVLITEAHIQLFKKYRTHVGISVDGPDELNDSRWAGNLEDTRKATAASHHAILRLCEEKIPPNLIITLYRGNARKDRIEKLLNWIVELERLGVRSMRIHLLEVENEDVREGMGLTEEETIFACNCLMDLQVVLKKLKLDLFIDMVKLLLGQDENGKNVSCIWNACDPLTTPAVQAVNGAGGRSNCNRTNKDGVDWVKSATLGHERYFALYETPQEDGGCKDCRFFFACKGQCPGTAIDGDWRNRSEQCKIYFNVFERIEQQLLMLGKIPISLDPLRRQEAEAILFEQWDKNNGQTSQSHGDHWDATDGYQHSDLGTDVHGDQGKTVVHGDIPHGDSNA